MKNFEYILPEGYTEVKKIDAKDTKVGLIMNLIAIGIAIPFVALAFLLILLPGYELRGAPLGDTSIIPMLVFVLSMIAYIVLHELTHGIAYKLLTKEKLTYGFTLTVAFCGVPHIYIYRRTAIIASAAPLVVFSVIFLGLAAMFYFVNTMMFIVMSTLFAVHLGGCCGDMYVILLMLTKFKDKRTLVRDTGPAQSFYAPNENI